MLERLAFLAVTGGLASIGSASCHALEGTVTWSDPTCGYFALSLPGDNPKEAFGLFSVKTPPVPDVGDVLSGDIVSAQEPDLHNETRSVAHSTIHWASAARQDMLVRNTPVQCASRWKKRRP